MTRTNAYASAIGAFRIVHGQPLMVVRYPLVDEPEPFPARLDGPDAYARPGPPLGARGRVEHLHLPSVRHAVGV